jgi:hypothetical protein
MLVLPRVLRFVVARGTRDGKGEGEALVGLIFLFRQNSLKKEGVQTYSTLDIVLTSKLISQRIVKSVAV